MQNKTLKPLDIEAEKQRLSLMMLPYYLLSKGMPKGKMFFKKLTTKISKIPYKQDIQIANLLNEFTATFDQSLYVHYEDIKDMDEVYHSYQILFSIMGIPSNSILYEHAELVDDFLKQKFTNNLVDKLRGYLEVKYNYKNDDLNRNMTADDFYECLLLSLIAHMDANCHYVVYSEKIKPISLGWLFMYKPKPDKWHYVEKSNELKTFDNINRKSLFLRPSQALIDWLLCIFFTRQNNFLMPDNNYNLVNDINWTSKTDKDWGVDDPEGKIVDFIKRKKEGKWITLDEFFWLAGRQGNSEAENYDMLASWHESMVSYIKSGDVGEIKSLPFSLELMIWCIYAFFQNIYQNTSTKSKKSNEEYLLFYPGYYGLWQAFNEHYESNIDDKLKAERIQWAGFITKQAIPIEGMT